MQVKNAKGKKGVPGRTSGSPPPPSSACPSRLTPPPSSCRPLASTRASSSSGRSSRAWLGRVQHPRPGPQPARGHAEGCRQEEGRRRWPRPERRRPPRHARAGGRRHRAHADRWPRRAHHHLRGVHSRAWLGGVQHPRPGSQPARGHAEGCRRRRRALPPASASRRRPPRHARAGGRRHRAHADRWPRRAHHHLRRVHARARLGRVQHPRPRSQPA